MNQSRFTVFDLPPLPSPPQPRTCCCCLVCGGEGGGRLRFLLVLPLRRASFGVNSPHLVAKSETTSRFNLNRRFPDDWKVILSQLDFSCASCSAACGVHYNCSWWQNRWKGMKKQTHQYYSQAAASWMCAKGLLLKDIYFRHKITDGRHIKDFNLKNEKWKVDVDILRGCFCICNILLANDCRNTYWFFFFFF